MPRVQDVARGRRHVRADQRAAIHHLGDVLQALRDLDVVDDRVDGREGAEDLARPAGRPRTACSVSDRTSPARPCRRPSRAGCTESAVGLGCTIFPPDSLAAIKRGSPAIHAVVEAAAIDFRYSRRERGMSVSKFQVSGFKFSIQFPRWGAESLVGGWNGELIISFFSTTFGYEGWC